MQELREIYKNRNGSAHTGFSTKEKVKRVRDLLINMGVLEAICIMK